MKDYIVFDDVYKRYKMGEVVITAANGVSFNVNKGEFAVVVGASGAGKTTVLNILGGIDRNDGGSFYVDGKNVSSLSEKELIEYRRHDIGFVFQFYNLIPNLTAKENVELASQICKDPMDAEEALKCVGLSERINNFPAQLSGGEQQRVSIARALAIDTRCCSPPDNCAGKLLIRSDNPTHFKASSASIGSLHIWDANSTFSFAVRLGIRL